MIRRSLRLDVLAPLAVVVAGCGPSAPVVRPTTPFTEEDAEIFEDGVDLIQDPEALEGRWREDWSRDLDKRVSFSDYIGVVRVSYLRTDTDPSRVSTYRIIGHVERAVYGEYGEDELELIVKEDEGGYGTIVGNEAQILDASFVAFVKWYTTESGDVAPHWHLAPATHPIVARVEYLVERRHEVPRDTRTTTIVHEN